MKYPSQVIWQTFSDSISSPGGFPEGVRLDNLLVTPPRPRSPLLADAFKRAGIVERTARGIDTIFFDQLRKQRSKSVTQYCQILLICVASCTT